MRRIVTPPTDLAVTVAEAKAFAPIALGLTDTLIETLIGGATADIENRLWDRAILTQRLAVSFDGQMPRSVDLEPNITELRSVTRWTPSDTVEVVNSEDLHGGV